MRSWLNTRTALAALALALSADAASAQIAHSPLGARPYDFRARSPQSTLVLQESRDAQERAARKGGNGIASGVATASPSVGDGTADEPDDADSAGADGGLSGVGALASTYAVGNWTQIDVYVGDNSSAYVINTSPQNSYGSQASTANIDSQNANGENSSVSNGGDWDGQGAAWQFVNNQVRQAQPAPSLRGGHGGHGGNGASDGQGGPGSPAAFAAWDPLAERKARGARQGAGAPAGSERAAPARQAGFGLEPARATGPWNTGGAIPHDWVTEHE
ncbi:hypothetical protein LNKW23_16710 [Paralimibaculum aggregatum]|uniref:Secreted protein n=1 Tax=Paralimibaculum aggregatum TaxID=3036245 RepID=A0ABQ6LGL7_9RHOB|nr:hypothetical protein [Limibaculum sp. NKW23]GMG82458.1 hypothetical protein LNKW23_16710 [Limibaculum sp. NKW23]